MRLERPGGAELYYEVYGDGDPLVLVHGSWVDHGDWGPLLDTGLPESFRVIAYDRRGHGRSGDVPGQGTRVDDEEDLAALLAQVAGAPAHVVGSSFGGSLSLGLAVRRPELFRTVAAHEPPLMAIVADDPAAAVELEPVATGLEAVLDRLRRGEHEPAARQFVDEVALGPGTWDALPDVQRQTALAHAPTFLDEQSDPQWAMLDLGALARCPVPLLLTHGTASPDWFTRIIERLAEAAPHVTREDIDGAGHLPHATHPQAYAEVLRRFTGRF